MSFKGLNIFSAEDDEDIIACDDSGSVPDHQVVSPPVQLRHHKVFNHRQVTGSITYWRRIIVKYNRVSLIRTSTYVNTQHPGLI